MTKPRAATPAKKPPKARADEVLENARDELFAQLLAQGKTATAAFAAAGFAPNRHNAAARARREHIRTRVGEIQGRGAARAEITVAGVLEALWGIATADANDLVEYRRTCCRYCYGAGHRYQRTPRELEEHEADHAAKERAWKEGQPPLEPFDPQGGTGFDARLQPHPHCPECFGQGLGDVVIKDTRELSPGARALYAGVKVTRDGLEVKMHDKAGALAKVGQHLGMFIERRVTAETTLEDLLDGLDGGAEAGGAAAPED